VRIEARELRKRFGRVEALRGLSFDVAAGQRVAIVGPNGSGKSTLNRVLLGLLDFGGEARIDGRDAFTERAAIAQRIAYVPQVAPALAAPVAEWSAAVSRLRGLSPDALARTADRLGLPLRALGGRPIRALSGGTRQKLLVAFALAAEPRLLILDEPTGSLDPESRARVLALVDELPRETTVLLCSHRLSEIRQLVDEVIALADGEIASRGPVRGYLDGAVRSVIEVAAEARAADWLFRRGFHRGAGGWFVRAVAREEKIALLAELPERLGADLRDVCVHEGDAIAPTQGGAPDAA
jgi:ABC-type multidrug transport system ATPase subunit